MQYRVYDRRTLAYIDGGYIVSYNIDDDYIVNNNSTINIIKKTSAVVGDIIALIEDSGAYHKGVITTVDNSALTISYKSDKELFNDNMLNPMATAYAQQEGLEIAGKFGLEIVAGVINSLFVNTKDTFKKLPITIITNGDVLDTDGNPKMLWNWSNDSINIVDWLVELFQKYNVTLSWTINFDTAVNVLANRQPRIVVTLSAITNSGGIIKDNVEMQTITYTEKELPDATVCYVINSETKELIKESNGINLININASENNRIIDADYNEYDDNESAITQYIRFKAKENYALSFNAVDNTRRYIIAYNKNKQKIGKWIYEPKSGTKYTAVFSTAQCNMRTNSEGNYYNQDDIYYIKICYSKAITELQLEQGDEVTKYDAYDYDAIYYLCEENGKYYVDRNIENQYRIMPVKTVVATFKEDSDTTSETTPKEVAQEKLIPSQFNQSIQIKISANSKMFDFANSMFGDLYKIVNKNGTIDSVYTGRKQTSNNKLITLYFGLGRQNYTDLIQIRLRKQRYSEIYNQR